LANPERRSYTMTVGGIGILVGAAATNTGKSIAVLQLFL